MKYIYVFFVLIVLSACDKQSHVHDEVGHESTTDGDAHAEEGLHLSAQQMETIGLEFGEFSNIKISDYVKATGTLGLPPNSYMSVNAKAEGFIRDSRMVIPGQYIKKGSLICMLENPAFIEKQENYLKLNAELIFLRKELDRQKLLAKENAGIERALEETTANVAMKEAELKSLESYLTYIGISPSNIGQKMVRRVPIYSPISGYISRIDFHNGVFVNPADKLMEIVDETHLHLELDVFEKGISQVKKGQKISYTMPAMGDDVYEGEVHVLGKEFDVNKKTVRIHGHLEGKRPHFIKELFVEAKIWLNDQTVKALPEEAVVQDGSRQVIYVSTGKNEHGETEFAAKRVISGNTADGFVSVRLVDQLDETDNIVVKGASFVHAQSKVGELEHEH